MTEFDNTPLNRAVQESMQQEGCSDLVTDWILVAATVDPEGEYGLAVVPSRDPMPAYVMKGLLGDALDHARDGLLDLEDYDD